MTTEDEKFLSIFNGSHATFIDLNTNSTATTFGLGVPQSISASGLPVHSLSQGGYDVFSSGASNRYNYASVIIKRRLSSDLKSVSKPIYYQVSKFKA